MRVAIAGSGSFAKHFVDELPRAGIEVVVLTRSHKDYFDGKPGVIEQRVTNYSSVDELTKHISDCDALISTILDITTEFLDANTALIEACKLSPKCKRFIPSEFGGNVEEFPEAPDSMFKYNLAIKEILRAQQEIEWTVISLGLLMDYIVPPANRYHADFEFAPVSYSQKTISFPGSGDDKLALTSVRDVARAVAALLKNPAKWRPYTYVQGEVASWFEIAESIKSVGLIPDLKVEIIQMAPDVAVFAEIVDMYSSGAMLFDQTKVKQDKAEFFPDIHFRSMRELLEEVKADPTTIV